MVLIIKALPKTLLGLLHVQAVLASPVQLVPRTLHACAVYVQRWGDNILDVYTYKYAARPSGIPYDTGNNVGWAETGWEVSPGDSIGCASGTHQLITTDVANPTTITDPGKLSFTWGTQAWDSYSPGSPCNVTAVHTTAGASEYWCSYSCDF